MPDKPEPAFDADLLELHLGRLDAAAAERVRARLAVEPQLAAQDARLRGVFAALNSLGASAPAPADLSQRVADRVRQTPRPNAGPLRIAAAEPDRRPARQTHTEAHTPLILRIGTLRDVIAVAAMVVLAVGVGIPSMLNMQERSKRLTCSQHLASVGQGLQAYAAAFGDSLPFAGWNQQASWLPSDNPQVQTLPNHKHPYRLAAGQYVAPQAFICPSQMHVPMTAEQVARNDDFLEARNVSYAYQNMAGARPSLRDNPDLPILSDENPLFADGVSLVDVLRYQFDAAGRNSPAHRGRGQNILSLDGHVRWLTSPNAGLDGDNIWTLQDVDEYTGREGPRSTRDSHMLK